ncbi:Na+/H+ antiporter subunit E [Nitrosomonas sp. ANs5]|uniref:Na+/H+ antiporter subunit E n=1 Tax=Nitrosomonas sp. ANs5 TaxID=3423941 RepID=UPI003D349735
MILSLVLRGSIFALLWWALTEGNFDAWWLGGILIMVATEISRRLIPARTWPLIGLLRFIPFFIERSLISCVDVAWRALRPGLHIDPILIRYPLRLPEGFPRIFMANVVSLLPGTLAAELEGSDLFVHVLDSRSHYWRELTQLEQHVAQLSGAYLQATPGTAITGRQDCS